MSARNENEKEWITPEWQQRGFRALQDMLDVSQDLKRDMVQFLLDSGLWDHARLSWESALARWHACLNPGRPETFKLVELWALAKRFDRPQLLEALAADLGFELRRLPSEERKLIVRERLLQELQRSNEICQQALDELAGTVRPRPVRVRAEFRDGMGSFDLSVPQPWQGF